MPCAIPAKREVTKMSTFIFCAPIAEKINVCMMSQFLPQACLRAIVLRTPICFQKVFAQTALNFFTQHCCKTELKCIFGALMAITGISKRADYLGVCSSILCLLHCLIPPAIILSSNALGSWFDHLWFDVFFALISATAVYLTTRNQPASWINLLLWASLGSLILGMFFEDLLVMRMLSYVAALGLIFGHLVNIRFALRRA